VSDRLAQRTWKIVTRARTAIEMNAADAKAMIVRRVSAFWEAGVCMGCSDGTRLREAKYRSSSDKTLSHDFTGSGCDGRLIAPKRPGDEIWRVGGRTGW
jgi:hypothetical protein